MEDKRCKALTKKQIRCARNAVKSGYCNQHFNSAPKIWILPSIKRDKYKYEYDLKLLHHHVDFDTFKPIFPPVIPEIFGDVKIDILCNIQQDVAFQILHKLTLSELKCLSEVSKSYHKLCFHPLFWMQKCFKDFNAKIPQFAAFRAYRGKMEKRMKRVKEFLIISSVSFDLDFVTHNKYDREFATIFPNFDPVMNTPYQILCKSVLFYMQKYYNDDPWLSDTVNGSIAQHLMNFKGVPFDCPDEMCPCYACGPQSPTLEIVHYLITRPGKKKSARDFVRDAKMTMFVNITEGNCVCSTLYEFVLSDENMKFALDMLFW